MIFFFPALLISCSLLQKEMKTDYSVSELLSKVCMRGEGRGKLSMLQKSYTFDYEFLVDDKKFLLGIDFPFHKEEFIRIDFNKDTVNMGGKLYRRLLENWNDTLESRNALVRFLSSWSHLLVSIRVCRNDPRGKSCLFDHLDKWWMLKDDGKKGRLTFSYFPHQDNSHGMIFDNFNIKKGYFNRQKIDIRFFKRRVEMEFFTNSCSAR